MSGPEGAELGFSHSPFMRFLGLEIVRAEPGLVEIRLPFRDEFLRTDGSDWLHGGVVSALADIAGDYAVITETAAGVPTIDMRVDYLRPARRGELVAFARTLRVGRTVSVADVEIRDTTGTLVAVGRACYASPRLPADAAERAPREEPP
ncbi:MAG TPA: PaaI family thioesterase [Methylomirabilota bacterium]